MRIRVIEARLQQGTSTEVEFESACGKGRARWASVMNHPNQGDKYDVEVDIDGILDKDVLVVAEEGALGFSIREGSTVLRARIEDIDDGLAYLRASKDCLIPVDTAGSCLIGQTVELVLPPSKISITVFGL